LTVEEKGPSKYAAFVPIKPYSWVDKSRTIALKPPPIYRNTDGEDEDPKIKMPTSTKKKANDAAMKKEIKKKNRCRC
jgi:hypothetical protein